jgi:hypothetical protein
MIFSKFNESNAYNRDLPQYSHDIEVKLHYLSNKMTIHNP